MKIKYMKAEFIEACESKQYNIAELIDLGVIRESEIERALILYRYKAMIKHQPKMACIIQLAEMFCCSDHKIEKIVYDKRRVNF